MAKRDSLKDQLKKAAKKRLSRKPAGLAGPNVSGDSAAPVAGPSVDQSAAGHGNATGNGSGAGVGKSLTVECLDRMIVALLELDRTRDDLSDRALMVGLKSVLRGYPGNDEAAAAVYQAVAEVKKVGEVQPRPMRAAIDQLLEIVMAYGSDRETPRSALTYLHSITS